jgi:hypothetical protein
MGLSDFTDMGGLGVTIAGETKLVPLYGEEIGNRIAQALEGGIRSVAPWYLPSDD